MARISSNIFRFIDNPCTSNNNQFENNYQDIYPDELELEKENEYPCTALFVQLSIKVYARQFTTSCLQKGMTFTFISITSPTWIAQFKF